jgi:hypothetical protein
VFESLELAEEMNDLLVSIGGRWTMETQVREIMITTTIKLLVSELLVSNCTAYLELINLPANGWMRAT